MWTLVLVYSVEKVAERTSWVFLTNTWARSRAEAVGRDLLVAYLVIDIRGEVHCMPEPRGTCLDLAGTLSHAVCSSRSCIVHILNSYTSRPHVCQ